jgi:hypothetical protein
MLTACSRRRDDHDGKLCLGNHFRGLKICVGPALHAQAARHTLAEPESFQSFEMIFKVAVIGPNLSLLDQQAAYGHTATVAPAQSTVPPCVGTHSPTITGPGKAGCDTLDAWKSPAHGTVEPGLCGKTSSVENNRFAHTDILSKLLLSCRLVQNSHIRSRRTERIERFAFYAGGLACQLTSHKDCIA